MTASEQIERVVLAGCLEDEEAATVVVAEVKAEYFLLDSHQRIFRAIQRLRENTHPVNGVTLFQELTRTQEIATVGGLAYLSDMPTGVPFGLKKGIREYTRRLREFWRRRELGRLAEELTARAESSANPDEILASIQQRIVELSASAGPRQVMFSKFADFVTTSSGPIDWMLGGVIERGSNGFIAADPKGSKSFCTADMAIALATGTPWLDFAVPRPCRVGIVSREDNPKLTASRLTRLMRGRQFSPVQIQYLEQNLYINSRAETATLMLDNPAEMAELIAAVKERKLELVFLDVLNVLHGSDENDNTEMAKILRKVKRIQDEGGAAVAILHHYNKSDHGGRITQRLRGASAIAGYAEWMIGLSVVGEEDQVRKMEFELKAAQSPDPVYFCIAADDHAARIHRVMAPASSAGPSQRRLKGVQ